MWFCLLHVSEYGCFLSAVLAKYLINPWMDLIETHKVIIATDLQLINFAPNPIQEDVTVKQP